MDGRELERLYAELTASTQLGALAQRIAHDLRGPLTSLSGTIEIESGRAADPGLKQIFAEMQAEADRMAAIIHSLTRFARPAGPSYERVALGDLAREVCAVAALLPGAAGVEISAPEAGGPETVASRSDLRQALFNLVRNAVEAVAANPGKKSVAVSLSASSGRILLSVADNGPGMTAEQLEDVFRKALGGKPGGSGMGLMIARDLLLRGKGELSLRPGEGGGLRASVLLPPA